ncbi:MAG: serine hydrolase domain-containing protein [Rubinisphaera brasiliensis]|uniref:Beta-lactamase n=1 Tax=Rubinisphaera brasiliensis (strain ATCC 49424 / DSM 5305 / JCM 21570 / IAM 15109 / NBRC 103401 / IFAM 1448) TaxID=756272 RepID=F0SL49_RUBBR|nr:serine hydrolase domain-containing protein [Rubinisphaera brasiliensis]ADY60932.1 beta-lactamase [Rubinisphaera brasiliensis DSM 5305]
MQFPRLNEAVNRGIERRLHLGVQVSISTSRNEFDLAFGQAAPDQPLQPEDSMFWLSAAKPITATVILQLHQEGRLSIDDLLADYYSRWAAGDARREEVTLRHLLTHSSPLQEANTGWPRADRETVLSRILEMPLKDDWEPGKRAAYLPAATWFLLGDIIEQTTNQQFAEVVEQRVLSPLGMSQSGCMRKEGTAPPQLYDRARGELQTSVYQERLNADYPSPGSSFRGPARELRLFYDALRDDYLGQGPGLLQPEMVRRMAERHRLGLFDETLQHRVDYGLGVIVDSKQYGSETVPYGFGEQSSEETFGHGGSQCAIGYADPIRERSVAIVANGRAGEGQHQRRFRELLAAMEEDLAELEG